jgi:hypothetical protein
MKMIGCNDTKHSLSTSVNLEIFREYYIQNKPFVGQLGSEAWWVLQKMFIREPCCNIE